MYIRTVILTRPSITVEWPIVPLAIQNLVKEYQKSGKLLERNVSFVNTLTIKDVCTWASFADFASFWNDPIYKDFIANTTVYTLANGITSTWSNVTIDSSNLLVS